VEREFHFFSGRNEVVRKETEEWLKKHVPITEDRDWELHMRKEGDYRPDTTVKYEMMYELKITPDDVLCILDDRQGVVDMWRQEGFRCLQVDAWKEPSLTISETRKKDELVQWANKYRETHEGVGLSDVGVHIVREVYRRAKEENNNES